MILYDEVYTKKMLFDHDKKVFVKSVDNQSLPA